MSYKFSNDEGYNEYNPEGSEIEGEEKIDFTIPYPSQESEDLTETILPLLDFFIKKDSLPEKVCNLQVECLDKIKEVIKEFRQKLYDL